MMRYPLEQIEFVAGRLEDWEPWLGSLLRLLNTLPPGLVADEHLARYRDLCGQTRESSAVLATNLRATVLRLEECEDELERRLELALSGFVEGFDLTMQESLHLAVLEFDLHRLGLGGAVPGHLVPTVLPLSRPQGEVEDGLR